jgi:hypothetical protein
MFNQVARKTVAVASAVGMLAGCAKGGGSFSTLADSASFKQEASYTAKKIDILWVIDNSGSMKTSQDNLASNFQAFIGRFNQNNNDFHMAVGTTDAWYKQFHSTSQLARLRDGAGSTHSGVFVMDKDTPNLSSVFQTNIKQGINGNGDERAFEENFGLMLNAKLIEIDQRYRVRPSVILMVSGNVAVLTTEFFDHLNGVFIKTGFS